MEENKEQKVKRIMDGLYAELEGWTYIQHEIPSSLDVFKLLEEHAGDLGRKIEADRRRSSIIFFLSSIVLSLVGSYFILQAIHLILNWNAK